MQAIIFKEISDDHRREDNIKEYIDSLPKGSTFYDLGACLGWFSIYAAALGLKTYAFEVDEFNFEGLEKNVLMNPFLQENIRTFNKGIADKTRIVNLRSSNQIIGGHHKTLDLEDYSGPDGIVSYEFVKEIEVTSLDYFIQELELPWPDHIKIDIDGSEYAFLRGNPISLNHASSLIIELHHDEKHYHDCVEIIKNHGFVLEKTYGIPGYPIANNYVYAKRTANNENDNE